MIRFSNKLALAVEAVLDIAYHAAGEPSSSGDVAARLGIPRRYLEQVLQTLVRAGVLAGVRGPHGGYRLARERRDVTLGELVRIIEGVEQTEAEPPAGSELGRKVLRPLWAGLHAETIGKLDAVTLQDLCDDARRAGVASDYADRLDFTI